VEEATETDFVDHTNTPPPTSDEIQETSTADSLPESTVVNTEPLGFKFPDEIETANEDEDIIEARIEETTSQPLKVTNSNRRKTNGKRPAAYSESRQPSRSSYVVDSYVTNSRIKVNLGNQLRWQRNPTTQPPMRRRTTTPPTTTTTTTEQPKPSKRPPPTPSTVTVPPMRYHSNGL